MKLLSAAQSASWLKKHAARVPPGATQWTLRWPEAPQQSALRTQLAESIARVSGWRGGALVIANSGMPRVSALSELAAARQAQGCVPASEVLWDNPGHLFDDEPQRNQVAVAALLRIMMDGYLEGTLATTGGRLVATVGCGVIDVASSDKSVSGKLRSLDGLERL